MTAVLARARAELRARLKSMLALTLLVGIGSAAVMTLAAGARRTDTAYPRFARAYKAADMILYSNFGSDQFAQLDFNKVAKLPQVASSSVQHFMFGQGIEYGIVVDEPPYGVDIDRYKLLEGRRLRAGSTDEAVVPYWTAKALHWRVGTIFRTEIFGGTQEKPTSIPATFRVVGIEAAPGEFPPQITGSSPGGSGDRQIHISPAAYEALVAKNVFHIDFLLLRFRGGAADNRPVNDILNTLAVNPKTGQSIPQLNDNLNDQAANVQRSIHLQAVALWLVAGLAALIIVLVLSQLIARQATIDSTESPTLQALGMTRTQLWLTGMGRALLIGVAGAAIGVAGAFGASTLMPIGVARIAEPNPGFSFDARLLGLAALIVIVLVLLLAAWPIWKSTRIARKEAARASKPSLAARTAAAPGFPPSVATGVRLALESGRGRTEVPVRSSLLSVTLAIVALAGALTFGAGLNHLLTTPRLYGINWDAHLTTSNNSDNTAALKVLRPDPRVEDIADLDSPPLLINDKTRFDVVGLDQEKGQIQPVVIDGRVPALPTEVALGVKTMRDVHAKIGDTVTLKVTAIAGSVPAQFKIVGTVVLPTNSDTARLGSGATLSEQALERMVPPGFHIPPPSDLYFTFAPGVNKKAALAEILANPAIKDGYDIVPSQRPNDLVNFGQVQNLPLLLAGLVGLLAAATLAHTLVTSIRRRRRDLAILKMLGFVPSQVRWTVAWQATTFVSAALLIGLPVGIAVGRVVWSAFATNLGTLPEPVTPSVRLLLTIPGAILLANLIAVAPAVVAGRMRPAPALRAE